MIRSLHMLHSLLQAKQPASLGLQWVPTWHNSIWNFCNHHILACLWFLWLRQHGSDSAIHHQRISNSGSQSMHQQSNIVEMFARRCMSWLIDHWLASLVLCCNHPFSPIGFSQAIVLQHSFQLVVISPEMCASFHPMLICLLCCFYSVYHLTQFCIYHLPLCCVLSNRREQSTRFY